jgi:hypothetical protein
MRVLTLAVCFPALLCAQDPLEIVRRSIEIDQRTAGIVRNYTYLQRQEQRDLDSSGKVKDTETRTWDVTWLEGSPYRRLVAHNDQPLSPNEQQKEEEQLQKSLEQRRKETKEQRERRLAEFERRQQRQREPVKELPDAFDFKLVGEEALNGGQTYVIDATPKPGYRPKLPSASYFPKVKARLWIDRKDYQWVKVEMESLDTISFGGIVVRLSKGSHLMVEQARINNEVWLPKRVAMQISARLMLVKIVHREVLITFSDYKKFQAESRVVTVRQ